MSGFQVIKLSGNARERGLSHGRQLADRIHRTFEFYNDVVFQNSALPEKTLQKRSHELMSLTRKVFPDLVLEIEAIAEAAEIPSWCVFLLNARTEVLNASVGECTSLSIPETRIMAQTWDWIREIEDLVVITKVEKQDGRKFVTLIEPGMLAKIGMNCQGLGIGLNFIKADHALDGVPVHLVLRALLDCADHAEARDVITRSGFGKASFVPVSTAEGKSLGFEFAGNAMSVIKPVDGVLLHTNHCLSNTLNGEMLPTSQERFDTTEANLGLFQARDLKAVDMFLSDNSGGDNAVQANYHPIWEMNGLEIGTCATIIMELDKRTFRFRRGPNPLGGYATVSLAG